MYIYAKMLCIGDRIRLEGIRIGCCCPARLIIIKSHSVCRGRTSPAFVPEWERERERAPTLYTTRVLLTLIWLCRALLRVIRDGLLPCVCVSTVAGFRDRGMSRKIFIMGFSSLGEYVQLYTGGRFLCFCCNVLYIYTLGFFGMKRENVKLISASVCYFGSLI